MNPDIQSVLSGERRWCVVEGDSLLTLREMPSDSVDAICTDPPYGLGEPPHLPSLLRDWLATGYHEVSGRGFMGQAWDAFVPQPVLWAECLRVLKPGGHLLAFAGTRTQHMMALAIQFAGFELRDLIGWIYGTGFPKSLDVSKAIDKAAGAEREVLGRKNIGMGNGRGDGFRHDGDTSGIEVTAPATPAARQWHGYGTALKPAIEPITLARKPLRGTVAANVQMYGTGAINVDACRVATDWSDRSEAWKRSGHSAKPDAEKLVCPPGIGIECNTLGRFPANLIHDGSEEALAVFPDSDPHFSDTPIKATGLGFGSTSNGGTRERRPKDAGSAARFFYSPKASKADREEGLVEAGLPPFSGGELTDREEGSDGMNSPRAGAGRTSGNGEDIEEIEIWANGDRVAMLQVGMGQSRPRVIEGSGIDTSTATAWTTLLFGNNTTDPSSLASTCTIETATSSTTTSRILSYLRDSLTSESTADASPLTASSSSRAANAVQSRRSLSITVERTVFLPGVGPVQSGTRLRLSSDEKKQKLARRCGHPTVKPTELMRYLCRLITPPGGVVLDPFAGSGSTGKAAQLEGFRFIGIDLDEKYCAIARARITAAGEPNK